MDTIGYANYNDHILTLYVNHDKNKEIYMIDQLYGTYETVGYKIIKIESIKTKQQVNKLKKIYGNDEFVSGEIYEKDYIKYFLSYEKAFYYYFGYMKILQLNNNKEFRYFDSYPNGISEIYREWYDNGSILAECFHINGKFDGIHKLYYKDGKIKETKYENDKNIIIDSI